MAELKISADYFNEGAPSNGVSEVQTLTIGGTPTSGTFQLGFAGRVTGNITWSSTNNTLVANIDAALEALACIGTGGVTVAVGTMTGGIGTVTITFAGNLVNLAVPLITVEDNSLEGTAPTLAVVETTPGVTATARKAALGETVKNTVTGDVYVNVVSTALSPQWVLTG